ncbi:hypothetical protein IM25_02795 [Rhodococcus sp. p52]|uniref:hypothetical protein n=1 Tax=Rhodococcus sp. p52 TaxID=935199 RepID=UPI00051A75D9|nr:hypothetical protein [Rhodococcus sp. p52]AOD20696.1 hypothetical protein IM25_02795 [Rhodococcus sp. p52]
MQSLACHTCGARVLVAKYSPAHTSIQWSDEARQSCREIATAGPGAYVMRCEALDRTVDEAVADGVIRTGNRTDPAIAPLASTETVAPAR